MQFCLCQPDPKIPRPRNGESILSASLEMGKCFSIVSFLVVISQIGSLEHGHG